MIPFFEITSVLVGDRLALLVEDGQIGDTILFQLSTILLDQLHVLVELPDVDLYYLVLVTKCSGHRSILLEELIEFHAPTTPVSAVDH